MKETRRAHTTDTSQRRMFALTFHVRVCVCAQDPPNAALECEVDGVATTTVVTVTMPTLSTTNDGMVTLTYEANVVGMTRGGPTPFNLTSSADEDVEELLICDDTSGASLYIDNVARTSCSPPMTSSLSLPGQCYVSGPEAACASGYETVNLPIANVAFICIPQN